MTVVAGRKCRRCRKPGWRYYPSPGVSFTPALPEVVCACAPPSAVTWTCGCGARGTERHPIHALFGYVVHRRRCTSSVAAVGA